MGAYRVQEGFYALQSQLVVPEHQRLQRRIFPESRHQMFDPSITQTAPGQSQVEEFNCGIRLEPLPRGNQRAKLCLSGLLIGNTQLQVPCHTRSLGPSLVRLDKVRHVKHI